MYLDPSNGKPHQYTMIFLHGMGHTATDLLECFMFDRICPTECRVVLPTAPKAKLTCSDGNEMHIWYDIQKVGEGIDLSLDQIRGLTN